MRPVMDPAFFQEPSAADRKRRWADVFRTFGRLARRFGRILLSRPIRGRPQTDAQSINPPLTTRLVRGLAYRMLFVPIVLVLVTCGMVYVGTHPSPLPRAADPQSFGVYYDPVNFVSADGTRLQGWLVPAVDARQVIEQQDEVLRARSPAIVLVHDHGQSAEQMLPLVRPLHEDGLVVLVVSLRGDGTALPSGRTFGINESLDVRAAVEMLRRRPFVDTKRIGVLGVGTGANAALLAADTDSNIAALLLASPVVSADEAIVRMVAPKHRLLRWLVPVCKWTFELGYHVNADDINLNKYRRVLASPSVVTFGGDAHSPNRFSKEVQQEIRDACRRLLPKEQPASASAE